MADKALSPKVRAHGAQLDSEVELLAMRLLASQ